MSHHDSYYYELERRRQEELARQRVAKNVREYLYRYRESINSIIREGLDKYVYIENINRDIREIESLLNTNPFMARDISYRVQNEIYHLRNRAIEAKREEERIIREQKSKNKEKILEMYYKNIRAIDDTILIDFAKDKFDSLKRELLEEDGKTDKDMAYYTKEIEKELKIL